MKKKERRFQSLEDIERNFRLSSGGGKKQKKNTEKTACFHNELIEDFLSEYGRLLVIPAASLILILLILILQAFTPGTEEAVPESTSVSAETEADAASGADGSASDIGQSDASDAEAASETAEAEEEPEGPIPCRISGIEQTVNDYFTARLKADTDTLYRIYGRTGDTGREALEKKLRAQASWIQSYDGIQVYTMPGMDDDSKVCIITYKINFRRTNTNAPGIMYCYMTKQQDGSWQIGENLKNDKVRYIDKKLEDPEVVRMQDEVDAELRNALNSDSTLALIYTSFLNGEIYNETAPDVNSEQEVDFLNNPADSDLAGGLVIENEEGVSVQVQEGEDASGSAETASSEADSSDEEMTQAVEVDSSDAETAQAAAETAPSDTETP